MNKQIWNPIKVIATGFIVTILFSLPLFLGRLFCNVGLVNHIPEHSVQIIISPSGLVPGEPRPQQRVESQRQTRYETPGPNEPDILFSEVYAQLSGENILFSAIGRPLVDITTEFKPFLDANERVYYWYKNKNNYIRLDKRTGLMNRRYIPGLDESMRELFAGPNGVSETASASLGRFYDPIISRGWDPNRVGFYDKKMRQFYVIDFIEGSVNKGLQLTEGDSREPIAAGEIKKGFYTAIVPGVIWSAPEKWNAAENEWNRQRLFLPVDAESNEEYHYASWNRTYPFIPLLDKTGLIYNYDTQEQSLVQVGYLPTPRSAFDADWNYGVANPRDVLGYAVWQVYAILRLPDEPNKPPNKSDVKYLGMNVACLSREGTSMTVAVFDPNGRQIYRGDTMSNGTSTAETVYSESDSSSATVILFLLENLQPPVFEVASYLCADCFEASAGHQALFILPNSFLGMLGRGMGIELFERQITALLLMGPSLILSVWLAWRIRKDAKLTGLSNTAKKWWVIGTIAFGLPAYITYRLTRHKEVLVTCQNCGNLRRPDMETCHHCGSKWDMPDLTPPNWRICD